VTMLFVLVLTDCDRQAQSEVLLPPLMMMTTNKMRDSMIKFRRAFW